MVNKRGRNRNFSPCSLCFGTRRGISSIIATLLLVLLTLALLSILWVVIRSVTSSAGEGISLGGLTLDLKIQGAEVSQNNLSVLVQRQSGAGDFTGINFVAYDGDIYEVVKVNTSLDIYEGREFVFVVDEINTNTLKTVSVAPLYLSGSGTEQVGSITDTYTFAEEDFIPGDEGESDCGNHILELGEQCDDGNSDGGDGCSSTCQDEVPGAICGNFICEAGETQASCPSDCLAPGPVCGNSVCEEGETTISCPGDCTLGVYICGNSVCEPGETASCPSDCSGCVPTTCELEEYQCGNPSDGCIGELDCGTCNPATSFCSGNPDYQCESYQMVNSGAIFSVWPSGAVIFFNSNDLPATQGGLFSYNNGLHYVRFPESGEPGCIRVALADIIEEGQPSYVALYEVANITALDNYEIWNSQDGCLNAL